MVLEKKISNKQFRKTLITAKLLNKISNSKNIILSNVILNSTSLSTKADLNKFSQNFLNSFKGLVFKFPAKLNLYENNAFIQDFKELRSIFVKNNNLLIKCVLNKSVYRNFLPVNVFKQLSISLNSLFYFTKFI